MTLALFFTRGVGLSDWVKTGIFGREKLIYERHLQSGLVHAVYWFSYGSGDEELSRELKEKGLLDERIEVIGKPAFFVSKAGIMLYSVLLPFIHRRKLRTAQLFKTNQIDGSWTALLAKLLFHKPLVVRCGYLRSILFGVKRSRIKLLCALLAERIAFQFSDAGIVTSRYDKEYLCSRLGLRPEKIHVVYNYVDTEKFGPRSGGGMNNRMVFVGRLSWEKNLMNLLKAMEGSGFALDLYGAGMLRDEIERYSAEKKLDVRIKGVVSQERLAQILPEYRYFVLPSVFEGMPKALIEAMACGLTCIAADAFGTTEVIDDALNGYLIRERTPGAIRDTLERAMLSADSASAGANAAQKVRRVFSLEAAVDAESSIIGRFLPARKAGV